MAPTNEGVPHSCHPQTKVTGLHNSEELQAYSPYQHDCETDHKASSRTHAEGRPQTRPPSPISNGWSTISLHCRCRSLFDPQNHSSLRSRAVYIGPTRLLTLNHHLPI